jgi:hypothetical protein
MSNTNLTPIKRQVTTAVNRANDILIDSQESLASAADILKAVKDAGKVVKTEKEKITKPLNESLKAARDLFRPIEDDLATGERIIKSKMVDYEAEIEAKRAAEAAKLEARVEKGTMRTDTAMRKMDDLETVDSTVKGAKGSVNFREVRKVKIVDPTKIPLKYLANEKVIDAIRAAVSTDVLNGTKVEGVEIVIEKVVASR